MGIFDGIARALGGLRTLSDEDLAEEREALRLRYVAGESRLYDELHRYDDEWVRRENAAYARENSEPREPRRREHGWYLPNDD
ncbi:UTP:GlnB (protein PII) uridylyltransferase [Paenarthrobacter nicotinovorans]|uniref:hypothetical protein n=1 Tax=Paenarthrobacter nicotinovorans TaxID=29320 RepID=UPI0027898045|nr:hypothetical protein [Paenarthrobacter nicotinovorans]MDP9936831.1 UTP:GlnB (protein PII) uridylyltransferase [Paenarthrobacter nicotinovorans]